MSMPSASGAVAPGAGLCTPSDRVDCDYVLSSRWGKIGPIPTAVFGFAYFASLTGWFVFVGVPNRLGRLWHLFPLGLVAIGVCFSIWFLYLMAARLPVWCTWCAAAHVVNGLLLLVTILAWPRSAPVPGESPYPSFCRAGMVLGGAAALVLVFLLASLAYTHQTMARRFQIAYLDATNDIEYVAWRHGASPHHEIPTRPDDAAFGDARAPFTLVAFSDFQCPNCRYFHRESRRLVSQFPGTLRCVFKHFPVSTNCNPHVSMSLHYFACEAARASEAARSAGTNARFLKYHELLYANLHRFAERPYGALAIEAGIEEGAFRAALAADEAGSRVSEDIALAHRLGVEATPALFLNGRRLSRWQIVTREAWPEMDVAKSLELWERLLGVKALINRGSSAAEARAAEEVGAKPSKAP